MHLASIGKSIGIKYMKLEVNLPLGSSVPKCRHDRAIEAIIGVAWYTSAPYLKLGVIIPRIVFLC